MSLGFTSSVLSDLKSTAEIIMLGSGRRRRYSNDIRKMFVLWVLRFASALKLTLFFSFLKNLGRDGILMCCVLLTCLKTASLWSRQTLTLCSLWRSVISLDKRCEKMEFSLTFSCFVNRDNQFDLKYSSKCLNCPTFGPVIALLIDDGIARFMHK